MLKSTIIIYRSFPSSLPMPPIAYTLDVLLRGTYSARRTDIPLRHKSKVTARGHCPLVSQSLIIWLYNTISINIGLSPYSVRLVWDALSVDVFVFFLGARPVRVQPARLKERQGKS